MSAHPLVKRHPYTVPVVLRNEMDSALVDIFVPAVVESSEDASSHTNRVRAEEVALARLVAGLQPCVKSYVRENLVGTPPVLRRTVGTDDAVFSLNSHTGEALELEVRCFTRPESLLALSATCLFEARRTLRVSHECDGPVNLRQNVLTKVLLDGSAVVSEVHDKRDNFVVELVHLLE